MFSTRPTLAELASVPSHGCAAKNSIVPIRFSRFFLFLFLAAAESGCWEGVTRDVVATVLSIDGAPTVSASRGGFIPLRPGGHAGKGAIIETPASSRAALALLPNVLVQLDPGTRIEIVRLALAKDGNETASAMRGRYAEVKFLRGRLLISHDWGEARAQFTVATPKGTLGATSNALFIVQSDGERTRVTTATGRIEFRPTEGGKTMSIPPGHVAEWSGAGSTIIAAESDAGGQVDLEEALDLEPKLRALRDQLRNQPPGR